MQKLNVNQQVKSLNALGYGLQVAAGTLGVVIAARGNEQDGFEYLVKFEGVEHSQLALDTELEVA